MMRKYVDRLLEIPAVYAAWQAPFADRKFAPVDRVLHGRQVRRVLDVGCGPGTNARRFVGADYVGIDINEEYLQQARAKSRGTFVCMDLTRADVSALGVFDTIIVNSVLHHLPDEAVSRLAAQLNRLLAPDGLAHVLELVLPERASMARLMARLDRGRFARPLEEWETLLGASLRPIAVEPYTLGPGLWEMVYFLGGPR